MERRLAEILFLIAWGAFMVGLIQKLLYRPIFMGLCPTAYLKFSAMCLLFGIGLIQLQLLGKREK